MYYLHHSIDKISNKIITISFYSKSLSLKYIYKRISIRIIQICNKYNFNNKKKKKKEIINIFLTLLLMSLLFHSI